MRAKRASTAPPMALPIIAAMGTFEWKVDANDDVTIVVVGMDVDSAAVMTTVVPAASIDAMGDVRTVTLVDACAGIDMNDVVHAAWKDELGDATDDRWALVDRD